MNRHASKRGAKHAVMEPTFQVHRLPALPSSRGSFRQAGRQHESTEHRALELLKQGCLHSSHCHIAKLDY